MYTTRVGTRGQSVSGVLLVIGVACVGIPGLHLPGHDSGLTRVMASWLVKINDIGCFLRPFYPHVAPIHRNHSVGCAVLALCLLGCRKALCRRARWVASAIVHVLPADRGVWPYLGLGVIVASYALCGAAWRLVKSAVTSLLWNVRKRLCFQQLCVVDYVAGCIALYSFLPCGCWSKASTPCFSSPCKPPQQDVCLAHHTSRTTVDPASADNC